ESRFKRFLDNKLEEEDPMWLSIEKGPYIKPMISNPDKPTEQIIEPLSKTTEGKKKQYIADVKVMNYLLQAIPNDIYNSVDACKNAKDMWERIKRNGRIIARICVWKIDNTGEYYRLSHPDKGGNSGVQHNDQS
ncbi:hypothetical protein Tco_1114799, partial [Tanacetum coccineum]